MNVLVCTMELSVPIVKELSESCSVHAVNGFGSSSSSATGGLGRGRFSQSGTRSVSSVVGEVKREHLYLLYKVSSPSTSCCEKWVLLDRFSTSLDCCFRIRAVPISAMLSMELMPMLSMPISNRVKRVHSLLALD